MGGAGPDVERLRHRKATSDTCGTGGRSVDLETGLNEVVRKLVGFNRTCDRQPIGAINLGMPIITHSDTQPQKDTGRRLGRALLLVVGLPVGFL